MMIDTWVRNGRTRVALLLAGMLGALTLGLTAPEMSVARAPGAKHHHHSKHKAGGSHKPTDGDADNHGGPSDGDGNV